MNRYEKRLEEQQAEVDYAEFERQVAECWAAMESVEDEVEIDLDSCVASIGDAFDVAGNLP